MTEALLSALRTGRSYSDSSASSHSHVTNNRFSTVSVISEVNSSLPAESCADDAASTNAAALDWFNEYCELLELLEVLVDADATGTRLPLPQRLLHASALEEDEFEAAQNDQKCWNFKQDVALVQIVDTAASSTTSR